MCQLDDGTIVSCSFDRLVMIGDYTIKNSNDNGILKVIASSSWDTMIKIWKSNQKQNNRNNHRIRLHILIDDKTFLTYYTIKVMKIHTN